MRVAVLGASDNPERYSYKAFIMLLDHEHDVALIHPKLKKIKEHKVYSKISEVEPLCHTLTVYVNPHLSDQLSNDILGGGFERVIFNPGAENAQLKKKLEAKGVQVVNECTLVMLSLNRF